MELLLILENSANNFKRLKNKWLRQGFITKHPYDKLGICIPMPCATNYQLVH